MEDKKKDVKERSFEFAVRVIEFVQKLPKNNAGYKIGGQLLDAATSLQEQILRRQQEDLVKRTSYIKWESH